MSIYKSDRRRLCMLYAESSFTCLDQEIRAMPITNDCASFEIAWVLRFPGF